MKRPHPSQPTLQPNKRQKLNAPAATKKINLDALRKKMQDKMEMLKRKNAKEGNETAVSMQQNSENDAQIEPMDVEMDTAMQMDTTPKPAPKSKPKVAFKLNLGAKKEATKVLSPPLEDIFGASSSTSSGSKKKTETTPIATPLDLSAASSPQKTSLHATQHVESSESQHREHDVDSFEAFMEALTDESTALGMVSSHEQSIPISNNKGELLNALDASGAATSTTPKPSSEIISDDDDDFFESFVPPERENMHRESILIGTRSTKKDLKKVDHSKMNYPPFRKNFFIAPPQIAKLTPEEIKQLRKDKGRIQIRGRDCPPPILNFRQCGLTESLVDLIESEGYDEPFPIQAQAIPAIMSGRDTIGIARTGSGKTLAFLLPMFRHVLDQPPLKATDGPIALIIAPTRELAVQINSEVEKFASVVKLTSMCAVGGAPISEQIAALKRGAHIVVCTPGRMIELLCSNRGRVTNLKRVTYVCLDEADRMFDLGFGPQITRIIGNIRPDKQVVMFSATFPKPLEALARNAMTNPVEITAGGRSIASKNVKQYVEIRKNKKEKFYRLLELLGYWQSVGRILIFVDRQSECGVLYKELTNAGYDVLVQHGGMDQLDRASTMESFKSGEKTILIATSVLARGLDVKGLELVINYDCPNHYEDYVHRVGRTGRAGKKGTAYTFITPEEGPYASNLVRALKLSDNPIPQDLQQLASEYADKGGDKKKKPKLRGYGGHGFKFDQSEQEQKKMEIQRQLVSLGEVDAETFAKKSETPTEKSEEHPPAVVKTEEPSDDPYEIIDRDEAVRKAREYAIQLALEQLQVREQKVHSAEIDINDFPQKARSEITSREYSFQLNDRFGVTVSTRGVFVPPGNPVPDGETKLHLLLEGHTKEKVERAKERIENTIRVLAAGFMDGHQGQNVGRYSVV